MFVFFSFLTQYFVVKLCMVEQVSFGPCVYKCKPVSSFHRCIFWIISNSYNLFLNQHHERVDKSSFCTYNRKVLSWGFDAIISK